jgi:signal transduction histidine kinase
MKKTVRLLVAFLCPILLQAQDNPKADSLLKLLPVAKSDSNKAKLLFSIADEFENNDPSRAIRYVMEAGELSKSIKYDAGVLKSYRSASYIYSLQSKWDSVLYYNRLTLAIARNNKDAYTTGVSLYNIGITYRFMSDLDSAVEYTLRGAEMLQGKGFDNIEAKVYDGLQALYQTLFQYDKAIEYGKKSMELARKMNDTHTLITAQINLGLSYMETSQLEEAKTVYSDALLLSESTNNKVLWPMVLNNLSELAIRQRHYELVNTYAGKAISLSTETGDEGTLSTARLAMALYQLTQQNYEQANALAEQALEFARQNNHLEVKGTGIIIQSQIAFAAHDFNKAFALTREGDKYLKEVFNQSLQQKEAALRIRFETEKKDSQIKLQEAELNQRKIINYFLIGGAFTLLIISLLSYRTYKQKQKLQQQRINELETEKQLAATEAVLKGEEQERTRLAKDLHDGLGGMLSGVKYSLNMMKGNLIMTPENAQAFERSMDMLDSSIREIRRVAHNMMPEALVKFGLDTALRDFCNDIDKSGALKVNYQSLGMENATIDQTVSITIYRIVQELINNTMKHAGAGNAIVQVSKTGDILSVTVEDDGKGFDTAILKRSEGIGWNNIQNRIEFLKGKMDVNSGPGKGTSVHIELNT